MGARQSTRNTTKVESNKKPPRCSLCKQPYTPMCDFMQGRCPHHPATIDLQFAGKQVRTRFQNIINFFSKIFPATLSVFSNYLLNLDSSLFVLGNFMGEYSMERLHFSMEIFLRD